VINCLRCFRRCPGSRAALVALAAAVLVLTSCGSGHVNPSRSPTLTVLPSRSNPPPQTQTETKTETRTESRVAIQTRTATQTQTETATRIATATPKSTQPTEVAANDDSSAPAWLWWLAGAVVLAALATTVVLLRRRSKQQAWKKRFGVTKGEIARFARQLIPQLEHAPTAEQMVGGWRIEADRIVSIEDQLTTLEATAVDDVSRARVHTLRDAVRASRTELAGLESTVDTLTATNLLRSASARLETALASVDRATHADVTRAR
jgi:hypothetical protein